MDRDNIAQDELSPDSKSVQCFLYLPWQAQDRLVKAATELSYILLRDLLRDPLTSQLQGL